MRLVIDASTLVAELLRPKGRALIQHRHLELAVTAEAWSETRHELRKRVEILVARNVFDNSFEAELRHDVATTLQTHATLMQPGVYAGYLDEARWRIPRDPTDVPSVALALALGCGIWTNDRDFFGCGLPVWVTETLQRFVVEQANAAN